MAKTPGKKPTNKDRDQAIMNHETFIRQLSPNYNALHAQVQDFFAVFSMFVEFMGKDAEFSEFIKTKLAEAEKKDKEAKKNADNKAKTPKIVDANGKDITK